MKPRGIRFPRGLELVFASLVLLTGAFLVYAPSLHVPLLGDDHQFWFADHGQSPLSWFSHPNPRNPYAYRPLEAATLNAAQNRFGEDTTFVHGLQVALHGFIAIGVFVIGRYPLRLGLAPAAAAASYFLVAQTNVLAVANNDTLSQVLGTLFVAVAISCHGLLTSSEPALPYRLSRAMLLICSTVSFGIALLAKETSAAFLPMAMAMSWLNSSTARSRSWSFMKRIHEWTPYLAVVVAYFALRMLVGVSSPSAGSGAYGLRFGGNVPINLALFGYSMMLPASSLRVAQSVFDGTFVVAILATVGALVVAIGLVVGCVSSSRPRRTLTLGLLAFLAVAPFAAMNHVGELYTYNSMPYVSLLVGTAVGSFLDAGSRSRRRVALLVLATLLAAHVLATRSKAEALRGNGERASVLIERVAEEVKRHPESNEVVLVNPAPPALRYSDFALPGFEVVRWADDRIRRMTDRSDLRISITDTVPGALDNRLVLSYETIAPVAPRTGTATSE